MLSIKSNQKVRICIIDDDPAWLRTAERFLQKRGFETLSISNPIGSSAEIVRFKPLIVLLDIRMPTLEGPELFEVFKKTLEPLPKIIFLSGIDIASIEKTANATGADDFAYKGDGFFRLLGKINCHLYESVRKEKQREKTPAPRREEE